MSLTKFCNKWAQSSEETPDHPHAAGRPSHVRAREGDSMHWREAPSS